MRFVVPQPVLAGAITAPARIANSRATQQAVGSVFIEALEQGALVISGTDTDTTVKMAVEASVTEPGRALMPARRLLDAVRLLEGDIEFSTENDRMRVVSGRFSGTIKTLPVGNFPTLDEPKGQAVKVRSLHLAEAVEQIEVACSTNEKQPQLMGVRVEVKDQTMKLIATDAVRIATREFPAVCDVGLEVSAVLPKAALTEASETPTPGVEFLFDEGQVTLRAPRLLITTRSITGKYPAYEKYIPDQAGLSVAADKAALIHSVKRVRIFADDLAPLDILLTEGSMRLACDGSQEELDAYFDGSTPFRFAVHPLYLLDGLTSLPGDTARIQLNEPNRPMKMEAGGFTYVLMPIRVRT